MKSLIAACMMMSLYAEPAPEPAKTKVATKQKAPAKKKPEAEPSDPTDRLVARVQKFYEQTQDLTADFVQTYTRVALSKTSESKGTVILKKPGKMKWSYKAPVEKYLITDGSKLYSYEPEEAQVVIDKTFRVSALKSSFAFLFGEGQLAETFTPKLIDAAALGAGKDAAALELVPKKDASYQKLTLIIDEATGRVTESILFETSGNTNRFRFSDPKVNTGVPDSSFEFKAPPGVEVVEP